MWQAWERGETCRGFWWKSPKENEHLEDEGLDGRMGSKWSLGRLVGEDVEWIYLDQNRDSWGAFVNAVMKLRVLAAQSYLVNAPIVCVAEAVSVLSFWYLYYYPRYIKFYLQIISLPGTKLNIPKTLP
jgi:hypothetical protein